MSEKYYKELTRILAKNGIETASPEKNTLPILLSGRPACRVEPSGCVCRFHDDLRTSEADELYHRVAPFFPDGQGVRDRHRTGAAFESRRAGRGIQADRFSMRSHIRAGYQPQGKKAGQGILIKRIFGRTAAKMPLL
ncbi:hypothetical protein SDC9_66210 [bioreactor metagenome]|uniref:Uncharacterized protein n=1 Tax=bioreactor metagenome TaxID=1076179 RepID=A0A644Y0M6_9ZZZZ